MSDETNYGPLKCLIGTWKGDKGLDIAPEPDGKEENPYYETIVFEAGGDLKNAEEQTLAIVPYKQIVKRKSNDEVFHHEVGYWLWDEANKTVIHNFTIPRAVCVVAGANYTGKYDGDITLEVEAAVDNKDWGIIQQPFMQSKAKTVAFTQKLEIKGNTMSFYENTKLEIYGNSFDHEDSNTLTKQ